MVVCVEVCRSFMGVKLEMEVFVVLCGGLHSCTRLHGVGG